MINIIAKIQLNSCYLGSRLHDKVGVVQPASVAECVAFHGQTTPYYFPVAKFLPCSCQKVGVTLGPRYTIITV